VIKDANGYFVFKAGGKDTIPLEKVRSQITTTLHAQRYQQYMKTAQQSATTVLNEEYFAASPATKAPEVPAPGASTPRVEGASPAK
jgi:hypothetical protein